MRRLTVPAARTGSWEAELHEAGDHDRLLFTGRWGGHRAASEARGHRAIGVVYDPASERFGNYVPTILPHRYDALLYIDRSHALHPLHLEAHPDAEPPETYPFGI